MWDSLLTRFSNACVCVEPGTLTRLESVLGCDRRDFAWQDFDIRKRKADYCNDQEGTE